MKEKEEMGITDFPVNDRKTCFTVYLGTEKSFPQHRCLSQFLESLLLVKYLLYKVKIFLLLEFFLKYRL